MSGAYERLNFGAAGRVGATLVSDVYSHPPLADVGM